MDRVYGGGREGSRSTGTSPPLVSFQAMPTTPLGAGGSGRLLDSLLEPVEEEVHLLFHQTRSLASEQIVLSMRGMVTKARHLRDIFHVLPVQHIGAAEFPAHRHRYLAVRGR